MVNINMNRLYVDDLRTPAESSYAIVRSYDDAVEFIKTFGCPREISFDHDLGPEPLKTGFDLAKWLVEQDLDNDGNFIPPDFSFNVHSANPPGAANINGLLNNYLTHRQG